MYYLYILRCADDTLYTGITVDLERRLLEHNQSARGAKYTKARRPVQLIFSREFSSRSQASRAEARVKSFSRQQKLEMVQCAQEGKGLDVVGA